jgi:hypothetical protein
MPHSEQQAILDEMRGELDKKNGQEPGWSGPATTAYMRGYGTHVRAAEHYEQHAHKESHTAHGWY